MPGFSNQARFDSVRIACMLVSFKLRSVQQKWDFKDFHETCIENLAPKSLAYNTVFSLVRFLTEELLHILWGRMKH